MINKRLAVLTVTITATAAAVIIPACLLAGNEPASETSTRAVSERKHASRRAREGQVGDRLFGDNRFTEDKLKEVMSFVKKHFPEEHERLEALRKEDPHQYRRAIRRLWWLYKRVRHLPEDIQAAAVAKHRLNVAIFQVRREFLRTDDAAKKTELTQKLRNLLEEQFDNDQTVKEYQIKRLTQQLAELKAQIEQRKKDRKKIISKRLEMLMKPMPDAGRRK